MRKNRQRTAILWVVLGCVAIAPAFAQDSGTLDLDNLHNYADQPVPDYIDSGGVRKDNAGANPITDEGATLGRVLFYDRHLSTANTVSCASCHRQEHAFSDLAQRSQGVNALTERHSMRLINTRFAEDPRFRWDKTAGALEDQMTLPIRNFGEMGYSGTNGAPGFDDLIVKLAGLAYYPPLFANAFGDSAITEDRIQLALAQFVRSIQSFDAKYDAGRAQVSDHADPFPNFTADENAGKQLFTEDFMFRTETIQRNGRSFLVSRRVNGGFNCASCHRPPEFDIDPDSLNNGIINLAGQPGTDTSVTRSPSLRDVLKPNGLPNGGLFHAGLTSDLNGVVAHYDFFPPNPQNDNLDPRYTPGGLPQFLAVTPLERQQLIAFLRTLSGGDVYVNDKWSDPFDAEGNLDLSYAPAIVSAGYEAGQAVVRIGWTSIPGKTYTVWYATDPASPSWQILDANVPADTLSARTLFELPATPGEPREYYRVTENVD